jgi:ABC-type uncharacterized transport system substrate-binding protein
MKPRVSAPLVFVAFLLSVFPAVSFSHPHVFLENSLTIIFDQQGLAGILVKWVFDEFFSSMIVGEFDRNHNGKLEDSEIPGIKKGAFSNLANFGYFTFIRIEGKPFKVRYVRDFSATMAEGKLIYEFLIPCHVKATTTFKEFVISQYDPSYYTMVAFAKDRPVRVKDTSGFEVRYKIAKNNKVAYYYGQLHPIEMILLFRRKHG